MSESMAYEIAAPLFLRCSLAQGVESRTIARNSGVLVARAKGKVRVLAVPSQVATALSLAEGAIALCLERVAFDTDDKPIEVMKAYYDLKNGYCRLVMR